MSRKNRKREAEALYLNNLTYRHYYNTLKELAISMFEWENLPDTIDARFLELSLFEDGMAVFFKDDVIGFLALQTMIGGELSVYRIPNIRTAYATNGYHEQLNKDNSVIIWNNMLRNNTVDDIKFFARKLYECDRTIDVNIKAQKTPVAILCDENQRLTMMNLYAQYDGNEPFIFGGKELDIKKITSISTQAPFIADKVNDMKNVIWNEALTYLGISNVNNVKKERLITDEVTTNMGATVSSRYSRLEMRKEACKKINKMFGLNIDVRYKDDYVIIPDDGEGGENE